MDKKYLYRVAPRIPIRNVVAGESFINREMDVSLNLDEVKQCLKCGPVFRKFANENRIERVTLANCERLHQTYFVPEPKVTPVVHNKPKYVKPEIIETPPIKEEPVVVEEPEVIPEPTIEEPVEEVKEEAVVEEEIKEEPEVITEPVVEEVKEEEPVETVDEVVKEDESENEVPEEAKVEAPETEVKEEAVANVQKQPYYNNKKKHQYYKK